jgi:hypothetical protein
LAIRALLRPNSPLLEAKVKNIVIVAGIAAAAAILGAGAAMAQGKEPTPPMAKAVNETGEESIKIVDDGDALKAFAKADKPAGKAKGKAKGNARGRGAN